MTGAAVPTIWAGPGAPWFAAVRGAIGELQADDYLREVVVVVPPGPAATALRRALPGAAGAGRGLASVTITTAVDLAHALARPLLDRRSPVTRPVQLAAARQVLAGRRLSASLERVREHPATLEAVADLSAALAPLALADPAEAAAVRARVAGGRPVAAELVAAAEATRERLLDADYRDEALLLATAATRVDRLTAPVVVALADELAPAQARFLAGVLGVAPAARLVAPHLPDDPHLVELVVALGGTPPAGAAPALPEPPVRSCPDADEECRVAVRRVLELVGSGVRPDRIALVHPAGSPHGRALREELTQANVPWHGRAAGTLAGTLPGQVLEALVDALDPAGDGLGPVQVFTLLSVAPHTPAFLGGRAVALRRPVARWEALARRLGIVTDADWPLAPERLARRHEAERGRALGGTEEAAGVLERRQEAEVRSLQRLLRFVAGLRRDLGRVRDADGWATAAPALRAAWHRQIGTESWRRVHWEQRPTGQHRAADRVRRTFDALEELERLAEPFDVAGLVRMVRALLAGPPGPAGEAAAGVAVGSLTDGGVLDVDHVVITGMNDGLVPPRRLEGLVVPDGPLFPGPDAPVRRARRAWQMLLGGVPDVLVTWARSDLRAGGRRFRSPWLADAGEAVASHAAGVLEEDGLAPWRTPAERLARTAAAGGAVAGLAATTTGHRRLGPLLGRLGAVGGPYDGEVPAGAVEPPTAGVSASWLEAYAACPFGHFVRYVLRVHHEDDPVEIDDPTPRVRGILAHQVLADLVAEWLARPARERTPWLADDAAVAAARARAVDLLDRAAEPLQAAGVLGHPAVWAVRRSQLLDVIGRALAEERPLGLEPLGAEVAFGDGTPGALAPLALVLDDGTTVLVRGAIDRIDRTRDGSLVVTDVKSGRRGPYVLPADDPTAGGARLQLPIYGLVARREHGRGEDGEERPVLTRYRFVGRPDEQEPVELPLTDDVVEALRAAAGAVVAAVGAGRFGPVAPSPSFFGGWDCEFCVPDGLGGDELAERVRLAGEAT